MHMGQIAHLGREHVNKSQENTGGTCKSQENSGGYLRSGDDLKKLENLSSCREVHMYGLSTNFMTLIPSLTFTKLRVVSMEHLQRVWLASRERLPFQTPGFVPLLGTCLYSNCWDQFYRTCCCIFSWIFTLNTPRFPFYTGIIKENWDYSVCTFKHDHFQIHHIVTVQELFKQVSHDNLYDNNHIYNWGF